MEVSGLVGAARLWPAAAARARSRNDRRRGSSWPILTA